VRFGAAEGGNGEGAVMVGVGNTAEVFDFGDGKVCKLFRKGYPKESVEREFRNAKEVQRLGLPVPKVFELVETEGRTGIVYEKIDGKSMLECIVENPGKAGFFLEEFVCLQKKWLKEASVHAASVLSYKEFLQMLINSAGQEVYMNIFDHPVIKNSFDLKGKLDANYRRQVQQILHNLHDGFFIMDGVTYNIVPNSLENTEAELVMSNIYKDTFGIESESLQEVLE
jgi:hypothetical protein